MPIETRRKATRREVSGPDGLMARRIPFIQCNLSADWEGDTFVVKSYDTPIAWSPRDKRKPGTVDYTLMGHTTRRHQNVALAWLPGRVNPENEDERDQEMIDRHKDIWRYGYGY